MSLTFPSLFKHSQSGFVSPTSVFTGNIVYFWGKCRCNQYNVACVYLEPNSVSHFGANFHAKIPVCPKDLVLPRDSREYEFLFPLLQFAQEGSLYKRRIEYWCIVSIRPQHIGAIIFPNESKHYRRSLGSRGAFEPARLLVNFLAIVPVSVPFSAHSSRRDHRENVTCSWTRLNSSSLTFGSSCETSRPLKSNESSCSRALRTHMEAFVFFCFGVHYFLWQGQFLLKRGLVVTSDRRNCMCSPSHMGAR